MNPSAMDPAVSTLTASLGVRRRDFKLDLDLAVPLGQTVALLGPNGAGKTTALRALAGLVRLDAGHITLDGSELAAPGRHVPPEHRRIGVVFQEYLLFPHLSTVDNVAFGPRCHGMGKAAARQVAMQWLERMGLTEYAAVRPAKLSGGQAQRVALARALAVSPRLLLLDEPLAALDAGTRVEVRATLRHHLAKFDGATVLVSHDPLDAMVLADRIVVLEAGQVVQAGTPVEITRHPRTEYVARLVGLNLYRGQAQDGIVVLPGGGRLWVDDPVAGDVFVAFPPSVVALYPERPQGSPRNVWSVRVDSVQRFGDRLRIDLAGSPPVAADVTIAAAAALDLAPGQVVWAAVKATETHAYPA